MIMHSVYFWALQQAQGFFRAQAQLAKKNTIWPTRNRHAICAAR